MDLNQNEDQFLSTIMPEIDSCEEIIRNINKAHMEVKIRLEQVSRLRIDCAKLQLELLKLFKPQCLEILEELRDISAPADSIDCNDGDSIESRDNQDLEISF